MTSPLRILPNVEALLTAFLIDDPDTSALISDRVYATVPKRKVYPLVRVTRFGGTPVMQVPLEIDTAQVQLDVWAETKRAAGDTVQTIRAAMARRLPGAHDFANGVTGVVTAVDFGLLSYDPDTEFDPAKPRYIADASITYRPI